MLRITPWERAALQLLANGKASDEIAICLFIQECEVEAYLHTLFTKMGAASRAEAVEAACRRGLVNAEEPSAVRGVLKRSPGAAPVTARKSRMKCGWSFASWGITRRCPAQWSR